MKSKALSPRFSSWTSYFQNDSLFKNAVRLQSLIRIIGEYAKPGNRVLEAGFGSGNTGVLLSDIGYAVTLLDIETGLFDSFQKRFPEFVRTGRIKLVRGDMYAMPFADQSFDLIYHQGVLEHFSDQQIVSALKEQARIGRLIVVDVPNSRYPDQPYGDERLLSEKIWKKFIQAAGLETIYMTGRRFPQWTYLLPHGFFLHPVIERLGLGRRFGLVSTFVCQSIFSRAA